MNPNQACVVQLFGNYIGTKADGNSALANSAGVQIAGGASNNTIGGTNSSAASRYGTKFALRITALMFVTMVIAALIVDVAGGGVDPDLSGWDGPSELSRKRRRTRRCEALNVRATRDGARCSS